MLLDEEKELSALQMGIINQLMQVYDPEIPANIYDLGLIYDIEEHENGHVKIIMTLTAPNCPEVDHMIEEIKTKISEIDEIKSTEVRVVFEPPWDPSRMSDEAKLMLGWM